MFISVGPPQCVTNFVQLEFENIGFFRTEGNRSTRRKTLRARCTSHLCCRKWLIYMYLNISIIIFNSQKFAVQGLLSSTVLDPQLSVLSPVLAPWSSEHSECLVLCPGSSELGPLSWVLCPGSPVLGPLSWILWLDWVGSSSWVLCPGSSVLGHLSWVAGPGSPVFVPLIYVSNNLPANPICN